MADMMMQRKKLFLVFGRTWESWVVLYIAFLGFTATIPGANHFPWWLIICVLCVILIPRELTWHGREEDE